MIRIFKMRLLDFLLLLVQYAFAKQVNPPMVSININRWKRHVEVHIVISTVKSKDYELKIKIWVKIIGNITLFLNSAERNDERILRIGYY